MIEVTRLNGQKYWVNPHQIETIEKKPDITLGMLSGRTFIIKETPEELFDKIIEYRRQLANCEMINAL